MAVEQSQYASTAQLASLSLTPQAAARYGDVAMNAALQARSSFADTFLASQFTLPLVSYDLQLTRCVCDMASFDLARQYGLNPAAPDFAALKSLFDSAYEWLCLVRDEKITPQYEDSAGSPGNVEEGGAFVITATTRGYSERGIGSGCPPTVSTGPFSDD